MRLGTNHRQQRIGGVLAAFMPVHRMNASDTVIAFRNDAPCPGLS